MLVVSHIGLLVFGLLYANEETPLKFFSFNVPDNVLHVGVNHRPAARPPLYGRTPGRNLNRSAPRDAFEEFGAVDEGVLVLGGPG